MEKEELKLGKLDIKMSTMLKGIAIILMVAHHFLVSQMIGFQV